MIYLYAVTEVAPCGFRCLGVDGEPVVSLAAGGLHLTHSVHRDGFEPPVAADALWAHEGIVDELLEAGAVLPFRFGTMLPDRAAAERLLMRERDRFTRRLAEVRGRVELAVRVAIPESDDAAPANGATYLAARARERDAHEEVLAPLASLAAARSRRNPNAAQVISASYLVALDDVERFASAVRDLQESHPDLALSCTGPWAPYSFVEEGA
jgi:hypothetical protein